MHTNHRRKTKSKFRTKHFNHAHFMLLPSLCPFRRQSWHVRRAEARTLMQQGRFSELPSRYPRNIYWDYW